MLGKLQGEEPRDKWKKVSNVSASLAKPRHIIMTKRSEERTLKVPREISHIVKIQFLLHHYREILYGFCIPTLTI
jgi:hypothetical protein